MVKFGKIGKIAAAFLAFLLLAGLWTGSPQDAAASAPERSLTELTWQSQT